MYTDFFKLKSLPFRLTADTRFHFLAGERLRAKVRLADAIKSVDGPTVLTGPAGVGKTILLEACLEQLDQSVRVACIRHPDMSPDEFYEAAVVELTGREPPAKADARAAVRFEEAVSALTAGGEQVLVVVDNAELASADLLEELMRLARRRRPAPARVAVLIAGRPELMRVLASPRFLSHDRSPRVEIALQPLPGEQISAYVEFRLTVAGADKTALFTPDAHPEIERYTGGLPELVNSLADAALTAAFGRNQSSIGASDIRTVASQLRWVEYRARSVPEVVESPTSTALSAYITIEHRRRLVTEHALTVGKLTLGRAVRNDICIESEFVSRDHCRILTTPTGSVIEDLQSQNGLIMHGQQVSVHRLHDGDVIQIGDHVITYRQGRPGARKPVRAVAERTAQGDDTTQTQALRDVVTPIDRQARS